MRNTCNNRVCECIMRVINSGSPLVFQLLGTDTWGLSRGPPAVKLFKIEISTQLSEELTTYNRYMTDVWSLRNTMHACTFSTGRESAMQQLFCIGSGCSCSQSKTFIAFNFTNEMHCCAYCNFKTALQTTSLQCSQQLSLQMSYQSPLHVLV